MTSALQSTKKHCLLFSIFWSIFLTVCILRMMRTSNGSDLSVIGVSQFFDIPVHIFYMRHFQYSAFSEWFNSHPLTGYGKFSYHFLPDLVSGLLLRIGLPVYHSLIIPSLIGIVILPNQFWKFCKFYMNLDSKLIWIAFYLFLFSSGLNLFFIKNSVFPMSFFEASNFTSTVLKTSFFFPNPIFSNFFSQRGSLWGLCCFLIIVNRMALFEKWNFNYLVFFSIFLTVLFLSQAHAGIVLLLWLILCLSGLGYKMSNRDLIGHFIMTLTIFIIIYLVFYNHPFTLNSAKFKFGIYDGLTVVMNMGGWIVAYFIIAFFTELPRGLRLLPLILFCLMSTIQFNQNPYENLKFLLYGNLFCSIIAVAFIKKIKLKSLKISLFFIFSLLLTGGAVYDVSNAIFSNKNRYSIISNEDLEISRIFKEKTLPHRRVLVQNIQNHWIYTATDSRPYLGMLHDARNTGIPIDEKLSQAARFLSLPGIFQDFPKEHELDYLVLKKGPFYDPLTYQKLYYSHIKDFNEFNVDLAELRKMYATLYENKDWIIFNLVR